MSRRNCPSCSSAQMTNPSPLATRREALFMEAQVLDGARYFRAQFPFPFTFVPVLINASGEVTGKYIAAIFTLSQNDGRHLEHG